MNALETENILLVAVPYYGTLSMPPLGLSRIFFLVAVDTASAKVERTAIQVWDSHKEPNLSVWLRQQGVSGVICSDSGAHYRLALSAERIWLIGNQEGEAGEVVERWAARAREQRNGWWLRLQPESSAIAA